MHTVAPAPYRIYRMPVSVPVSASARAYARYVSISSLSLLQTRLQLQGAEVETETGVEAGVEAETGVEAGVEAGVETGVEAGAGAETALSGSGSESGPTWSVWPQRPLKPLAGLEAALARYVLLSCFLTVLLSYCLTVLFSYSLILLFSTLPLLFSYSQLFHSYYTLFHSPLLLSTLILSPQPRGGVPRPEWSGGVVGHAARGDQECTYKSRYRVRVPA
jgi:hypothetical protein